MKNYIVLFTAKWIRIRRRDWDSHWNWMSSEIKAARDKRPWGRRGVEPNHSKDEEVVYKVSIAKQLIDQDFKVIIYAVGESLEAYLFRSWYSMNRRAQIRIQFVDRHFLFDVYCSCYHDSYMTLKSMSKSLWPNEPKTYLKEAEQLAEGMKKSLYYSLFSIKFGITFLI